MFLFTVTHLSEPFFSLPVMLLLANFNPVGIGSLETLRGHSGISEADKDGVVAPTSTI